MKINPKIEELKIKLQDSLNERRLPLLKAMEQLDEREVNCKNCPGTCCTFMSNSMQMTIAETWDLYDYLQSSGLWTQELRDSLKRCIDDFRLLNRPSTGGSQLMRKTYTCPFFTQSALGCPLPKTVKPYGCLGFNPKLKNELSGKSCSANHEVLLQRESGLAQEEDINNILKEEFSLAWEKESIPVALLDLDRALSK
ncbi:MAG: hypothetical protein K9K67_04030 [Bacteriovoracaceae bacterium]|nr:hypothetical protein [Bacteriovoracaceae bacterium]